jgi:hypothetical protein
VSRTVLTLPDLPTGTLTQSAGDVRYLPLTGGNLSGPLTFGTAPSGDATLSRTGPGALRADTHLGVGVNPAAWQDSAWRAVQVGMGGAVAGHVSFPQARLSANTYYDSAGAARSLAAGSAAALLLAQDGSAYFSSAPNAAGAGVAQTFTTRLAVAQTGTLTLTPDAATNALVATGVQIGPGGGANGRVSASAAALEISGLNGYVHGNTDNAQNLGHASVRWVAVYAVNGTIQTSSREYKEGITPLDPVACYQAAKDVRWYEFAYLPPAYQEPPEQEGQEPEERQRQVDEGKAAHARMLVETAPARHQRGFVFPDAEGVAKDEAGGVLPPVPELFGLSDRQSTTPQADLATLGAATQEIIRRLETLEDGALKRIATLETHILALEARPA